MTSKDLILVANILLDCEEQLRDGNKPLLGFIQAQCKQYKVSEAQEDIIKLVTRVSTVYNIGSVRVEYSPQIKT